ncbi:MAG: Sapep family Mn(2+)-dependent dipeptidase [Huintestinicola sp.]
MEKYSDKIKALAKEYYNDTVDILTKLVAVPSVLGEAKAGMPYGESCAKALHTAEDILEDLGFKVKNFGNHAITASYNDEPAELGILCHLDVVPVNDGWSSDPFMLTNRDGKLFGRGAIDDKGPAAAVITAMRIVKELGDMGVPVKKNFRLILGSNEENGSTDMEYYRKQESFPPMLFTPDGSFPVINIEKGMLRYDMTGELLSTAEKGIVEIWGGEVYNAVPDSAYAVVRGYDEGEIAALCGNISCDGVIFSVEKSNNNTIRINARGRCVHASTPEDGKNAVTAIISLLSQLDISSMFSGLAELFPYGETDGSSAKMKASDEKSGALTLVLSRIRSDGNTLTVGFDSRFPVTKTAEEIASAFDRAAEKIGMRGERIIMSESHYADENSDFVRTLLSVYEDVTGKKGECLAIGGGTYVHDTENGVAFGAEHEGADNHMHGADEYITEAELLEDIVIYAEAVLRLCC